MQWFLIVLFLSFAFNVSAEGSVHHEKKLPSAVVVGTVYCDTCFQQGFSRNSYFISGASVAVDCEGGAGEPRFRREVKTDQRGEFKVQLPFSVAKHVRKIESCSVELVSSSEPYCSVTSKATSAALHLQSRKQGIHIFSAGFFTFKPSKQPNLCNEKPSEELFNPKKMLAPPFSDPSFPPPLQDLPSPPSGLLPPIPTLLPKLPPLPQLPLLPPLLGLPMPPIFSPDTKERNLDESSKQASSSNEKTTFPEFSLPPNPLVPPPAPLFPFPPVIGLTPPPPVLPFPFPPFTFPFPPSPAFPGIPPASDSSPKQTSP